jgi:ubiquinone/menaquinone biosynthesis C-methylase UbiE
MVEIDPDGLELSTLRGLVHFAGRRVVEIGAGDARLAWPFASEAALWIAADPDVEEVTAGAGDLAGHESCPVRLVVADGRALSLPAGCFDLALFTWSLC